MLLTRGIPGPFLDGRYQEEFYSWISEDDCDMTRKKATAEEVQRNIYYYIYILYNYITYKLNCYIVLDYTCEYLPIHVQSCTYLDASHEEYDVHCDRSRRRPSSIRWSIPKPGKSPSPRPGAWSFRGWPCFPMFSQMFGEFLHFSPLLAELLHFSPIVWRQFLPLFSQFLGECLNLFHHFWVSFSFFSHFFGEFLQFFQFFGACLHFSHFFWGRFFLFRRC